MGCYKLSFDGHFEQQNKPPDISHISNAPKKRNVQVIRALSFPHKPCNPARASKNLLFPSQLNSAVCSLYMDKHDHQSKAALHQHFQESAIHFRDKKPSGHQDLTFTSIEQRNLFIDGFSAHGANLQRRCTFNTRAMSTQESYIARFFQTYGAHVSVLDFPDMRLKG